MGMKFKAFESGPYGSHCGQAFTSDSLSNHTLTGKRALSYIQSQCIIKEVHKYLYVSWIRPRNMWRCQYTLRFRETRSKMLEGCIWTTQGDHKRNPLGSRSMHLIVRFPYLIEQDNNLTHWKSTVTKKIWPIGVHELLKVQRVGSGYAKKQHVR